MSLPKLNWKMLPPYIIPLTHINITNDGSTTPLKSTAEIVIESIFSAFSANTYYDGTPRVTGSGVAWSFYRTSSIDISPTNKGATTFVYGFPATSSIVSQSIVFAATRSSWSGGTLTSATNENFPLYSGPNQQQLNTLKSNDLYAFISRGADRNGWSYKGGVASSSICNFFNSASSGVIPKNFTGSTGIAISNDGGNRNTPLGYTTDFLSINIWESEEAIILVGNTRYNGLYISAISSSIPLSGLPGGASVNYSVIFMGGAIFDPIIDNPNSSSFQIAEDDGRLYGLLANSRYFVKDHLTMEFHRYAGGIGNAFYSNATSPLNGDRPDLGTSADCFYIIPNTLYGPVGRSSAGAAGNEHTSVFNPSMYITNFAHYYAKAQLSSSNIGRSNNDCSLSYDLSNLSNKSILLPIYMTSHYNQTIIGKLRDIYTGKKMKSGMIIKSGSADYLYTISPSMYTNEECFYLKA